MSIKLVNVEKLPLTLELATAFRDMVPLKGERHLKKGRCDYFRDALRVGTFRDVFWSKCTIGDDLFATQYRGDGQHTSTVLAELSETAFPQGLTAVISTYHLDNEIRDAGQYFEMFNNPISARGPDDRMRWHRARYQMLEEMDVSEAFLTKVAKLIALYRTEMNKDMSDREAVVLMIYSARERGLYFQDLSCQQYAVWLWQWRTANNKSFFKLDNELLVDSYYHWKAQPEEATALWSEIFQETNDDPDSVSNRIINLFRITGKTPIQKRRLTEKARRSLKVLWDEYLQRATVAA